MRILLVTQYFWPEEFRINDLAVGLHERGHEVVVLTGIPNYPAGAFYPGYRLFKPLRQEHSGIQIIRVPLVPRGKATGFRLAVNYISYFILASLLGPFLCHGDYDVIIVYQLSPVTVCIPAILLKWLKRAPLLMWVQDLWPESLSATGAVTSNWVLGAVRHMVRAIYSQCDRILVQSPSFSRMVISAGGDAAKIRYYPNSVEKIYRPMTTESDLAEKLGLPSGFIAMFAGNIGAAQSFETILSAAALLGGNQHIHWVIIGDGRMRPWVEAQIADRGLGSSVHLLGRHPVDAMPRYFAHADVLLVTLKRDPIFSWTIPSKLQSYMACARPIVAAVDGEGRRLIEEAGCGVTCSAEDAHGLAAAILSMYRKPKEERERMGKKGKLYCEFNFEREKLITRLEGYMSEVLPKKSRTGAGPS